MSVRGSIAQGTENAGMKGLGTVFEGNREVGQGGLCLVENLEPLQDSVQKLLRRVCKDGFICSVNNVSLVGAE